MKKIIALILSALMLTAIPTVVSAEAPAATYAIGDIAPYSDYDNNSSSTLSISGTTATCKSKILVNSDVKSIKVEQTLQKKTLIFWGTYDDTTWTTTISPTTTTVTNTKRNLESGTYRLKTVFTVTTTDGKTESFTVYSDTAKVS